MRASFVKSKTLLLSSTALIAASSIATAQTLDTNPLVTDTTSANVNADFSVLDQTTFTVDGTSDVNGYATGQGDVRLGQTANINGVNGAQRFVFTDNRDNIQSTIDGEVNSDIQFIIIDKDGVFFSDSAVLNVQGILASTGDLVNGVISEDGSITLENVSQGGSIINNGHITVNDAGLAAFVAPTVINNGVINARMGNVVMAAGDVVTLDMYGDGLVEVTVEGDIEDTLVRNSGTISTAANVQITAEAAREVVDSLVNTDGIETADSVSVQGGKIVLYADNGNVENSGQINGGDVKIAAQNFVQLNTLKPSFPQQRAIVEEEVISASISTNGGDVDIEAENVSILGGHIDAEGGDINIDNSGTFFSAQSETLRTQGEGTISLRQNKVMEPDVSGIEEEYPEDQFRTALATSLIATPVLPGGSIQNAIDAISNTGTGLNTINVGAGTYNESVNLDHNNTALLGNNAFTFPGAPRDAESIIIPNSPGVNVTADNTAVAGFTITGDGTDVGILVDGAENVALGNNVITNVTNGIFADGAENVLAILNDITANEEGIYFEGTDNYIIGLNTITDSGSDGILVRNSDFGIIGGNTISNAGSNGIRLAVANEVDVIDNDIDTTRRDGIRVENGILAVVEGNIVHNAGNDGIEALGNNGLKISGNEVYNSAVDGIDVTSRDLEGTEISHNIVDGTGENGINHEGPDGTSIFGNEIANTGLNGIYSTTLNQFADSYGDFPSARGQLFVYNNQIENAGENGIFIELTNDDAIIEDNQITQTGANGIYLEQSDNATVYWNTVMNAGSDGILLRNSDNGVVERNKIRDAGSNGIRAGVANNIVIKKNDIDTTRRDGVRVENGVEGRVFANRIENAGNDGIEALGNNGLKVIGNKVYNSSVDGIDVTTRDLEGTEIAGNYVNGTGANGINHEGPDGTTIAGNTVLNAGLNGIYSTTLNMFADSYGDFPGARGQLKVVGNTVKNSAANGIFIELTDNDPLVKFNKVDGTGAHGIYLLDSANADVALNGVKDTEENGIYLERSDNGSVVFNKVNATGSDGILIRNSDFAKVAFNGITESGSNGIRLGVSNNAEVRGNIINTTVRDGIRVENGVEGLIIKNRVSNAGNDGIEALGNNGLRIAGNTVRNSAVDGIDVTTRDLEGTEIVGNFVDGTGANGINHEGPDGTLIAKNIVKNAGANGIYSTTLNQFADSYGDFPTARGQLRILNNRVDQSGENGIFVELTDNNPLITDNRVTDSAANGILLREVSNVFLTDNRVTDSTVNGLFVEGEGNGLVTLSGNRFIENGTIGGAQARFESGDIDLSGASNVFINTSGVAATALQFDDISVFGDGLSLVGNTLGTTEFTGYTPVGSVYVEISEGTFLDGGSPILIDADSVSFDGVIGGAATPAELVDIEDRLIDADDAPVDARGQIFEPPVVVLPPVPPAPPAAAAALDNTEDFIQEGPEAPQQPETTASLRINGLPSTGEVGFQGALGLNDIAPAAGGEATSTELASINPEAGETQQVTCAGDLAANIGNGPVTYGFGGTFEDGIVATARCSV